MKAISPFRVMLIMMLAMLVPMAMVIFGSSIVNMPIEHDIVYLDDNWTVTVHDTTYSNVFISDVNFQTLKKGESVTLTTVLPASEFELPCISFSSSMFVIDAYLDNKEIYSFGHDYFDAGRMVPDIIHYVPITDGTNSHIFTLVLTSSENSIFTKFGGVSFGDRQDLSYDFMRFKRIPLFISVFLFVFSILILILVPYLIIIQTRDISIMFSAGLSLCLGLYIFTYNEFLTFYVDKLYLHAYLNYLPLYFIPFNAICLYLSSMDRKVEWIDVVLATVNFMFPIGALLLHISNLVHLCLLLSTSHIIILISSVYIVIRLIIDINNNIRAHSDYNSNSSRTILLVGVFIMTICALIDMLRLYVRKYYLGTSNDSMGIVAVTYGSLALVLCIIVNYFMHCMEHINSKNVKAHLQGLAYSDALTGLANRARCEQMLAELSGSKKIYTIVSLDLDHLKQVNDSLGHHEGDVFIQGFADMLVKAFPKASLIGRMGGDEFIVIMFGDHTENCPTYFQILRDAMDEQNSKESKFSYSASWGFAVSSMDSKGSAKEVYMVADSRMYSMKQRHHNATIKRIYDAISSALVEEEGGADNDDEN